MDSSIIAPKRVAAGALLETWSGRGWTDGVVVDRLLVHERISVKTRHSLYEIIVLDPRSAEVLVRGGVYFPEFTRARVAGCSLGGSFLKLHGVYVGFRLELHSDTQAIVTSVVETVTVSRDDPAAPRLM